MQRFRAGALTLALLLLAGCNRSGSPSAPSESVASASCPYAGAIVDASYPRESDLDAIRRVFVSFGWNPAYTGVQGVINGTLTG